MSINEIIFHGTDKKELEEQIGVARPFFAANDIECSVLDTPKSVARFILEKAGIEFNPIIKDFNKEIQHHGLQFSQEWIEFISSLQKQDIWSSLKVNDSLAGAFQYTTLLNRNREIRSLFDEVIRLHTISTETKGRKSTLVVSSDLFFIHACKSLGFTVGVRNLRLRVLVGFMKGFVAGCMKRLVMVLVLLFCRLTSRSVQKELLAKCAGGNKNIWIATTFFPGLVSSVTGHDSRYHDVATSIEMATGTKLLYAGWVTMRKDLLGLAGLLRNMATCGPGVIFLPNFIPIGKLIHYILPIHIFRSLQIFNRNKNELDLMFLNIPMRSLLTREFCISFLCTGNTNESFYYYHLIEQAMLGLLQRVRPVLVTTFLEGYNFGRSMIAACRLMTIPVLGWQESVLHPMRLYYRWSQEMLEESLNRKDARASYLFPDAFCVWSEYSRKLLKNNGIPGDRILDIGAVRYREFVRQIQDSDTTPCGKLCQKILLVGTAFIGESIAMADFVCEAFEGVKNVEILFRPHPQLKSFFSTRTDLVSSETVQISENSLAADLLWSDVVVSSWSTLLCEAFIMGKQCVSIFTSGWVSQPPLPEGKCSYFTKPEDLREWITCCGPFEKDMVTSRSEFGRQLFGSPEIDSGYVINKFIRYD